MKPFKLLIGYDGSDCAKKALQDLASAGLPKAVEAVVLSITDTWPVTGQHPKPAARDWVARAIEKNEDRRKQLIAEAKQLAWEAADALSMRYPGWTIRGEGKADDPAWGLVTYSDTWKPDLIVLGCQGRSAVGRFFLGSVSQKVLSHAEGSVRVVHPEANTRLPPRLIVAFDGSANARRAVRQVAQRTWSKGTQVRLISVMDEQIRGLISVGMSLKGRTGTLSERRRFWMKQVVAPALKDLQMAGLQSTAMIRAGNPEKILIGEAKSWNANCIFVSARGLIAIERFLLGSVSTHIAANAPCSVEVVR